MIYDRRRPFRGIERALTPDQWEDRQRDLWDALSDDLPEWRYDR